MKINKKSLRNLVNLPLAILAVMLVSPAQASPDKVKALVFKNAQGQSCVVDMRGGQNAHLLPEFLMPADKDSEASPLLDSMPACSAEDLESLKNIREQAVKGPVETSVAAHAVYAAGTALSCALGTALGVDFEEGPAKTETTSTDLKESAPLSFKNWMSSPLPMLEGLGMGDVLAGLWSVAIYAWQDTLTAGAAAGSAVVIYKNPAVQAAGQKVMAALKPLYRVAAVPTAKFAAHALGGAWLCGQAAYMLTTDDDEFPSEEEVTAEELQTIDIMMPIELEE